MHLEDGGRDWLVLARRSKPCSVTVPLERMAVRGDDRDERVHGSGPHLWSRIDTQPTQLLHDAAPEQRAVPEGLVKSEGDGSRSFAVPDREGRQQMIRNVT